MKSNRFKTPLSLMTPALVTLALVLVSGCVSTCTGLRHGTIKESPETFQVVFGDAQTCTDDRSFTWTNPSEAARITLNGKVEAGSMRIKVFDAASPAANVYDTTFGTSPPTHAEGALTYAGVAGTWTVQFMPSSAKGTWTFAATPWGG
ncbi:MAG: hypothetical protein HYT80_09225 [Euryarchaeota archaeon]|nr:hypothetical protein [Euryarchaeota archaeon]